MTSAPASAGSRQFRTSEPSSSYRKFTHRVLLLARLARQLLGVLAAAIRTHEFLDVLRRAVLGNHQQVVFGLGAGDTRDLTRLGVAQASACHRRGDLWQILERTGDPHFLSRRAHRDSTLPVQPMRTRLCRTVRPAIAPIEFGDENQPAMVRRVDVASRGCRSRRRARRWNACQPRVTKRLSLYCVCVQYTLCAESIHREIAIFPDETRRFTREQSG